MHHAGRLYSLRCGMHMLITCADDYALDVLWPANRFMHLCGVAEYRVRHCTGSRGAAGFYQDALSCTIKAAGLVFRDHPDDIETKMAVIDQALGKPENIRLAVGSSYRGMCAFFGCGDWSIGVFRHHVPSTFVPGTAVTVPGSLSGRSITWKGFPERGCVVKPVIDVRLRADGPRRSPASAARGGPVPNVWDNRGL